MKLRNVCSLVGLLFVATAVELNAWQPCFKVVCEKTSVAVPGAEVVVTLVSSDDCKDFSGASGVTGAGGEAVCIPLCEVAACYTATVGSSTKDFCLPDSNGDTSPDIVIEVPCAGAPGGGGCPDCVAPELELGAAAGCTVLELSTAKVSITGPAGGIFGDICIAPGGSLAMSGDEFVTGTINLGFGAKFSNSSHGTVTVAQNVDLTAAIDDANARAKSAAELPCNQSYVKLDGSSVTTITGGVGINVICVGDVVLSGKKITLTGPAGAQFIFNVTGKFVLTGGGAGPQIRVSGGVEPKDVLYNIIGLGADVAFSGGGGGVNCCAAIVDGTLLAPERKINLSPGLVNGQVISGRDINIVSGASVNCPCPPPKE